jgi:Spy/CpxP family protein refolding chaperone
MRRVHMDWPVMGPLLGACALVGCAGESATNAPVATAPPATATSTASTPAPPVMAPPAETPAAETAPPVAAASSPEDEESAADLGEHHRHHHHGGVVMFIAMTLDSLGVSPEQQAAVEKIQGDLFAKMEPAHVAEQKVLNVLADGIAAGKIDNAKVDAAIGAVKVASAGLHQACVESLNQLHAALTPEQRATLVDKVEAHWEVWKEANGQEEKPGDTAHPGHLDLLAKDLNLAPDQVEKIRATFAEKVKNHPLKFDPDQVEIYIQEFGTAFKAETFDAKTLQHGPVVHQHLAVWGAKRMAHFYEAIDPLLTPEQRTKLSAQIKEHGAAKSGIFDGDKHER